MTEFTASAPGRCGLLGNPSDIYGGKVLSCSITARNSCTLTLGQEDALPEDLTLWRAATARYPIDGPVRVTWDAQIPRSSGLAGSTALLAATLGCVLAARGHELPPDPRVMGELVRDIERHEAGVICGYQDAQMVVHGGLQLMDFHGKHPRMAGPLPVITAVEAPTDRFLVITTGVERLSGSVHGPMVDRWLAGDGEVIATMDRLATFAPLGAKALAEGDDQTLAEMMNENQARIAALGGSGDAIDGLIAACRKHGAHAAKLAGAGLGGTVVAFVDHPDELAERLRGEGYSRFLRIERGPGLTVA